MRRRLPEGLVGHLGSQWWCLTRRTLEAVLTDPRRPEYDRYFRATWIPDESYFQTLSRRHSAGIENRSLTISKFDRNGRPYMFYDDHGDLLARSGCFVARKIWHGAAGLYDRFPQPAGAAEPDSYRLDRIIETTVARSTRGRPGLYMQSRFPRKDAENGKSWAPYSVLYGVGDVFTDLAPWLGARVEADLHGHLFAEAGAEFAGGAATWPGALVASAAVRDRDPQGFLTALIRMSRRHPVFQFSPRDRQELNWFVATDPNARIFVVTGGWLMPLLQSDMPFDDVRRMAGRLQRAELAYLEVLNSPWVRARVRVWDLAQVIRHPGAVLAQVCDGLRAVPAPQPFGTESFASRAAALPAAALSAGATLLIPAGSDAAGREAPPPGAALPEMRRPDGLLALVQRLSAAGLRLRHTGDFRHPDDVTDLPIILGAR